MNMKKLLCVALMTFGVMNTAMAEDPAAPVEIQFGREVDPYSGTQYAVVYITATDDSVVLQGIRSNRSNCRESIGNPLPPVPIAYGSMVKYKYTKCQDIIETEIYTNAGMWKFNRK